MSQYIVLACPACGGKTSLSSDTRSATCDYCGSQMILNPRAPQTGAERLERPAGAEPIVPRAPGVTIERTPAGLEIRRRWFNLSYIALAVFCVFWDGFLVFFYASGIISGAPAVFLLFPLIHVAVGMALTYSTVAGFVNSTYISLGQDEVRVEHGPLPYPGNVVLQTRELRQLFTQEVVQRTKNGTRVTYSLCAVTADGRKKALMKGLQSADMGLYVEKEMERYLGIADQPVVGEVYR